MIPEKFSGALESGRNRIFFFGHFLVNFENRFVKNEESEVPDLKNSLLLALATMKTF